MHPVIHGELARARIADLHRQAERDGMARAARSARGSHRHFMLGYPAAVLARRVLAVMAAHSPRVGSSHDRRTAPIKGGTP
jgi:hypothetical protein